MVRLRTTVQWGTRVHSQTYMYRRILKYSDAMFFYNFFEFFFFLNFFCHHHTTAVSQVHRQKRMQFYFELSSWRRRFNNNNNSKQCCFKNQRWQNNPFSSESKQKSGHLVPVSDWWVWQCLSWETFLPTVPCQRPPLSLARVSVGLESARWPGFFFFFFFFCRIFEYEKSFSSSCQQCRYSSIQLLVAALVHSRM